MSTLSNSQKTLAVFSTRPSDRKFLEAANTQFQVELKFFEEALSEQTAVWAQGCQAVCVFVNDRVDAKVLEILSKGGTRILSLRCAGANNVDLNAARLHKICVTRVPEYSPCAVAEHALTLILALNRKICRSNARVREANFSLEGLLGFDLHKKTIGIVGTGKIGRTFAQVMSGFSCRIIAYDPNPNSDLIKQGVEYGSLEFVLKESDIISLHCPLLPTNFHMINKETISLMKKGVMLINTGRGALIDTKAVIAGLKSQHIGYLGLDVYEEEAPLFFQDRSDSILSDDVFARLLTFPNVLITGHQAYFTKEALEQIASTTLQSVDSYLKSQTLNPAVVLV